MARRYLLVILFASLVHFANLASAMDTLDYKVS